MEETGRTSHRGAQRIRTADLATVTWSIERSCRIAQNVLPTKGADSPSYYYQTNLDALENDGDVMVTLDVFAPKVGIIGIFSDQPATVTDYTN